MFRTFFLEPVYNIVVFFLNLFPSHDVGIAVILTTILVKLILLPINLSSQKSSYLIREAQVEIEEIKNKYKDDKQKIATETMKLYKEKKIKPFSSFLLLLIQIPVFFALYYVFKDGVKFDESMLYSFNKFPATVEHLAFGFIEITQKYWWIGVLTGITMFIYSKRQTDLMRRISDSSNKEKKDGDFKTMFAKNMQFQMTYFLPIISGVTAAFLPAVIGIYWIINNVLSIIQDVYIRKKLNIKQFIKDHNK